MKNTTEPTIPTIKWDMDNHRLTWSLITQLEKEKNRPLFFGKVNKSDNTSGDSKEKVFKRIAAAVFPTEYAINSKVISSRVKSKINWLISTYKVHEKRLRVTGEGIGNCDGEEQETRLQFYINSGGPDENTPQAAVNIWNEIMKDFPFFARLHRHLSSRPNVVPIVVATPLGPQGGRTTWFQPPDNSVIDPVLLQEDQRIRDQQSAVSTQSNSPSSTPSPTATGLRASGSIREVINKAVRAVPQKRPVSEIMLEIARNNLEILKEKAEREDALAKRTLLLEEFKAGVWTREEYANQIRDLQGDEHHSKRRRIEDVERYSPEWPTEEL